MEAIRYPAVAGSFYPADPGELHALLDRYLGEADTRGPSPKALIAPHAGYVYSGPVAATGYARLRGVAHRIHRVVLMGPSHRVPFRGLALPGASHFRTPLGDIAVDALARKALLELPQVHINDAAHFQEHSLEVHLPFLQATLEEFTLVPIVVGDTSPEAVCEAIELLWGGPETLVVISSDLSHYHDYDTAAELDHTTSRAIESLAFERISHEHACGRNPVSGLLLYARRHGLRAETIDLRNSGDTAGPRDQVVGYGTFIIPGE